EVGLAEKHVERYRFYARAAIELVVHADVVSQHRRSESRTQPRDRLSHSAAAEDADGRRRELSPAGLTPGAVADHERGRHNPATQREHEGDGQLSDGLAVDARSP